MKVIFCTPSLEGPSEPYVAALEQSIPLITAAGWEEGYSQEIGCPYISAACATMLRRALDAKADVVVFLEYDMSWSPPDLLKLIETPGDVVAGNYRYKKDEERYMGSLCEGADGKPIVRKDGAIKADLVPAGFLKITKEAVHKFMGAYPELMYGPRYAPLVDLFNHGAIDGVWWGQDYAFSKRWNEKCGDIWIVPDLDITHHAKLKAFPGNFHKWLLRQPGGSEELKLVA